MLHSFVWTQCFFNVCFLLPLLNLSSKNDTFFVLIFIILDYPRNSWLWSLRPCPSWSGGCTLQVPSDQSEGVSRGDHLIFINLWKDCKMGTLLQLLQLLHHWIILLTLSWRLCSRWPDLIHTWSKQLFVRLKQIPGQNLEHQGSRDVMFRSMTGIYIGCCYLRIDVVVYSIVDQISNN